MLYGVGSRSLVIHDAGISCWIDLSMIARSVCFFFVLSRVCMHWDGFFDDVFMRIHKTAIDSKAMRHVGNVSFVRRRSPLVEGKSMMNLGGRS